MPQIDQVLDTYASQIFWLLVFFGITYFLIGRGMVPKVMGTVELRDRQIGDDLAAAQAARDSADTREAEWRAREAANRADAQDLIAQAKTAAAASSAAKLAETQGRLDMQLAAAQAQIEAARDSALTEIEHIAADAAREIVARVSGAEVDQASAERAVKEALAHA